MIENSESTPRFSGPLTAAAKLLLFAALYVAAARLGVKVDFARENERVFWPQSGVAVAGLLLLGLRYWPGIVLGSLYHTISSGRVTHPLVEVLAAGNTLEAVAAAWMLGHFGKFRTALDRVQDVYAFLFFAIVIAPVVSATINIAGFLDSEPTAWTIAGTLWVKRWFGHGISNMIVAPVLLTWGQKPKSRWPLVRIGEAVVLFLSVLWISLNVFTNQSTIPNISFPVSFAPFPFVIWAALRFGQRGATTATFMVSAIAVLGLSQGYGPFVRRGTMEALILVQIYLTVVALSALFLAAALAERKSTEEQLVLSQEQLRALTARLDSAREEERARISREVHDELGQQLTGLKMGIWALDRKIPAEMRPLREKCEALAELTDEAVESVRRIASDLRPGILDDLGITAAMHWQVEQFQERSGVAADFVSTFGEAPLDRARRTALFRILQEALTNVARHAQARTVHVNLRKETDAVVLEVRDDGIGIVASQSEKTPVESLGLVGMRERAQILGGSVVVSTVAPGTLVRAIIPVDGVNA